MDNSTRRQLLVTAGAATLVAGFPAKSFAEEPRRGGTLTVHMPQEQRVLNPALRASIGVYIIASKIMEPLMDLNEKGELDPMLATSWQGSPDGKTITIRLREGVKWHDGKPFSSADVQYTAMELWKKYQNYGAALHAALEAVDVPDASTAIFRYSRPMPLDLFLGAMPDLGYIAPRHIYEGTNVLENPANVAPIGTGPFTFTQYERGQYVIAERNPEYWRKGFPYLDKVIWRFIPDKSAATAAIESSQVLMSNYSALPLADIDRLGKDPRFEVSSRGNERQPFQNTIEFNLRRPELADVRVRRAIIHAVDTDYFIENFLYGKGKRANGPIPSSSTNFYRSGMPDYPFDMKKADTLLDDAGFKRNAEGMRFPLKMVSPPFGEEIPLWSTFIQQSLQKLGIKVEIQRPDMAGFITQVFRDWNFDLATDWHIYRADPAISTMVWYRSGSPKGTPFTNQWGWADDKTDKLIDDAAVEIDPTKRRAAYPEIVKLLNTEVPLWMATERQFISVTNKRLKNHHNNPRWPSSHWADVWLES
jgi:peptide/nickel transport system substrate-binding protein